MSTNLGGGFVCLIPFQILHYKNVVLSGQHCRQQECLTGLAMRNEHGLKMWCRLDLVNSRQNIPGVFAWVWKWIHFGFFPPSLDLTHQEHLQSCHPWPCIKATFKIICVSRSWILYLLLFYCRYLPNTSKGKEKKVSAALLSDHNSHCSDHEEGNNAASFALEAEQGDNFGGGKKKHRKCISMLALHPQSGDTNPEISVWCQRRGRSQGMAWE